MDFAELEFVEKVVFGEILFGNVIIVILLVSFLRNRRKNDNEEEK